MPSIKIEFPLPPPEVRANSRSHWAKKGRVVKEMKKMAYDIGLATKAEYSWIEFPLERARVTYHFYHNREDIDLDNFDNGMKAYLDGLAKMTYYVDDPISGKKKKVTKSNLLVDDSVRHIDWGARTFTKEHPPRVVVEIEPL